MSKQAVVAKTKADQATRKRANKVAKKSTTTKTTTATSKGPKTQATTGSVTALLNKDPKRAGDAATLSQLMSEATGEKPVLWGTAIVGFGSYTAASGPWPAIGFSPRSSAFAIYGLGDFPGREALLAKLGKHKTGTGCLYVSRLADVDTAVLKTMISKAFKAKQAS